MKSFLHKLTAAAMMLGGVASASEHGHAELSSDAPILWEIPLWPGQVLHVSNSLVMFAIAILIITLLLRLASRNMKRIPGKLQNFVEWIFETLYNFVEGLTGKKLAKKYFWYFATVFLFILVSNYLGLLPGVGSVTYEGKPLFRGANADFNVTIFLGFSYAILWFVWVMKEQGPWHFLTHTFGPKGGLTGFLKYALLPIFFFVGLIEILSICVRPVALAARLFGNIFAGESILEQMGAIGWFAMLPFMFLEVIVGFVQALVFLMLTAIFLKTQLGGDEEEEAAH
ncbi:MAG: F0F1 ATP synthase subunit A [Akkermansiaceae bacterium]|nr:F0F1 ATP synthase subunit A [Akkermansiaceae bacterium]